ncbi:MAG: DUF3140 domain-containing protein [Ilumatobacteraceae bacterium]
MAAEAQDLDETHKTFKQHVNMSASELEKWLGRDRSKEVGQKRSGESTGHASGRRIVSILRTKKSDLTADDARHMRKVTGYIKRHLAQRPTGEVRDTRWRASLMNWGHDPTKKLSSPSRGGMTR